MTLSKFFLGIWINIYLFSISSLCFQKKSSKGKRILFILLFAIFHAINLNFSNPILYFVFYMFLNFIFLYLTFSIDLATILFFSITIYFFRFLFEEFFYFTLYLLRIHFPSHSILYVYTSILTIMFAFLFKEKLTKTYFFTSKKPIVKYILFNIVLGITLYIQIPKHQITKNKVPVFLFIMLFNLTLLLLREKEKNKILEYNYKKMVEYSKFTENLLFEYKSFLHEYKNKIIIIKGLAKPRNKELHHYIDTVLNEKAINNYRWLMEIKAIPIPGVKGLINFKLLKMKELGINMEIYIAEEIAKLTDDFLTMKEKNDLYTILGIILDNALEGSLESKEKAVSFQMFKEKNGLSVLVANTFKSIHIDHMDEKGFSTKGKNRGIGLHILKETLKQNENISKETSIVENYFVQKIEIKKRK